MFILSAFQIYKFPNK